MLLLFSIEEIQLAFQGYEIHVDQNLKMFFLLQSNVKNACLCNSICVVLQKGKNIEAEEIAQCVRT